ncbi:ZrgA family zinc uptake protein [Cochlodiniinecator piscidefendens]|uniref:ZrgA family zinc uptake protein n=1 Tax=Cochlodiniinecator piscidefendens TaxID=2715756 RepID=UPI00140DB8B3|nr:DUF2796 domain-containing protein [Cochlodiniinecator piscidefendens]
MTRTISLMALLATTPALAEENRQLDPHEHGVGILNIAIDGTAVAMEFQAPGADIVGFEYAAESEADHAKIDAAVATLMDPLNLFALPDAAECTVTQASAELESEEHEEHTGETGHTEFHAEFTFTCVNSASLSEIAFPYFDTFENARKLEVQIATTTGAHAFEVERDAPLLDLRDLY